MPRYFFNIEDGTALPDVEGAEFCDVEAARREASRRCGVVLSAAVEAPAGPWLMLVTDEWGLRLFTMRPAFEDLPYPMRRQ
jgi:hypothetical protein